MMCPMKIFTILLSISMIMITIACQETEEEDEEIEVSINFDNMILPLKIFGGFLVFVSVILVLICGRLYCCFPRRVQVPPA